MSGPHLITQEFAIKVNSILCNMFSEEAVVQNKEALEKVFANVEENIRKRGGNPLEILPIYSIGIVNESPFKNCNKRTALALFNYYLSKNCEFYLADSDKYPYVSNFKDLGSSDISGSKFKLWVQDYINLRIIAKVNNAGYDYSY